VYSIKERKNKERKNKERKKKMRTVELGVQELGDMDVTAQGTTACFGHSLHCYVVSSRFHRSPTK
jgi:hypothetical protein